MSTDVTTDPAHPADDTADPLAGLAEREQIASANGLEIAYDVIGDADAEPLLLIMGLGTQLIHWDHRFCSLLAESGYMVIRFDNRDAGHSTKLHGAGTPATPAMLLGLGEPAYRLSDMARDAVGLLDHLGLPAAHVVGASMGGMIAQTVAIEHPDRVRSLGSIMSTTGNRRLAIPSLGALGTLLSRPPRERDAYADAVVKTFSVIGSKNLGREPEQIRALALAAYDRCFYPSGAGRQLHAITSSGDRTRGLQSLRVPAVVIHGSEDPLIRPAAGRATAKAIPGSDLTLIEGMGHDLPMVVWPRIVAALDRNARRAGSGAPPPRPKAGISLR